MISSASNASDEATDDDDDLHWGDDFTDPPVFPRMSR